MPGGEAVKNDGGPARRRSFWRRMLASRCGQIAIPAVFIFPTMFIFIYLLFETAKLSREKIRHQFAVDSASFIEMTNYSDYLNRTAYVNGSFPHRIFLEAFSCTGAGAKDNYVQRTDNGTNECLYDILYSMGAFPKNLKDNDDAIDSTSEWDIEFSHGRGGDGSKGTGGIDLNSSNPQFPSKFDLFQHDPMIYLILSWEAACGIYKLYAQVYMLLGSVQASQRSVYQRLTEGHNFFRKSYYLNTGDGDPATSGQDGVKNLAGTDLTSSTDMKYINSIYFAARKFVGGIDPLKVVETKDPIAFPSPGLFQLATVDLGVLKKLGTGVEIYQGWDPPAGYFMKATEYQVFAGGCNSGGVNRTCVHSRIAVQCPKFPGDNNCIWPHPTPKYQTRLYP